MSMSVYGLPHNLLNNMPKPEVAGENTPDFKTLPHEISPGRGFGEVKDSIKLSASAEQLMALAVDGAGAVPPGFDIGKIDALSVEELNAHLKGIGEVVDTKVESIDERLKTLTANITENFNKLIDRAKADGKDDLATRLEEQRDTVLKELEEVSAKIAKGLGQLEDKAEGRLKHLNHILSEIVALTEGETPKTAAEETDPHAEMIKDMTEGFDKLIKEAKAEGDDKLAKRLETDRDMLLEQLAMVKNSMGDRRPGEMHLENLYQMLSELVSLGDTAETNDGGKSKESGAAA